jgi:PEP-CTERM motif
MRLSTAVALGAISALLAWPAHAATVFDNYNGVDNAGFFGPPPLFASGFIPTANYNFTSASAFVENLDIHNAAQPFSMALYSSTGGPALGTPGSPLWTSGMLSAPGPDFTSTLVTASNTGPPILLQSGDEYFLALNFPTNVVDWLDEGPNSTPFFSSRNGGGPWTNIGPSTVQYQIFGSPLLGSPVPEPATWVMMLVGFAGLGFAGYRRSRRGAVLS